MSFEDLLLPNAEVLAGEYLSYVTGTSLLFPLAVEDGGTLMSFASGYTATMTLNLGDGTDVLTWTNVATGGRVIDLNPTEAASLVIRSTPAGMATLDTYRRQALAFNLIVTRTSDGLAVDLMRDCFIIPLPEHD